MIYLNNAATTYPKPPSVLSAQVAALQNPPASQYRGADAFSGGDVYDLCRKNLGKVLGIVHNDRIFFASGATDAINRLLGGLDLENKPVVTTQTEHNSVLRPLYNSHLQKHLYVVPCLNTGKVTVEAVSATLSEAVLPSVGTSYAGLFILNHCSNVTGMIQSVAEISEIVHQHGFLFMLDVSQSAGCMPVLADEWRVDMLAFTGHKSLFGPQGTGGYYVHEGIPFRPTQFGGTGRDSSRLIYEDADYEYEVGTQNTAGIAGLNAGLEYILDKGLNHIEVEERHQMAYLYDALSEMPQVILYGNKEEHAGPLLSFNLRGMQPSDVAYILQNNYQITIRTGLHCAPLIHRAMGTEKYGTLRVSISDLTTMEDLKTFVKAVGEIAASIPTTESV